MGEIRTVSHANGWDVQEKDTQRGQRYRYRCTSCGHPGRWFVNPNDADGDEHLYAKHGQGE